MDYCQLCEWNLEDLGKAGRHSWLLARKQPGFVEMLRPAAEENSPGIVRLCRDSTNERREFADRTETARSSEEPAFDTFARPGSPSGCQGLGLRSDRDIAQILRSAFAEPIRDFESVSLKIFR